MKSMADLKGGDFLNITDLTVKQLEELIETSIILKRKRPIHGRPLTGKTVALIFAKPSTRTRISFEIAIRELGGDAMVLYERDLQLGRGETFADTGAVMSRYVSAIAMRTSDHSNLESLAAAASIPIINMLSDSSHPCQALADMMTIKEKFGHWKGLKLAYVGDGNNVAHSLIEAGAMLGMEIMVASPPGYEPDPNVVKTAAAFNGGAIEVTSDAQAAVQGAHVVYTDTWTSMGDEDEAEERRRIFAPYQVSEELCAHADPGYIFMHCLPAHRGEEVTDAVIDGPHSVVFDQAENRLHVQKALLQALLG